MPKPRQFDTDETISAIRDVFWRQGYEATSISDLVEATDVKAGSLHAAFGTKADLFALAFRAYGEHFDACMATGRSGGDAIRAYLYGLLDAVTRDEQHKGCLIVQSSVELALHTESNRAAIKAKMDALLRFFHDRLAEEGLEDERLAAQLFGATVALLTLGRSETPRHVLQLIVEGALDALARGEDQA